MSGIKHRLFRIKEELKWTTEDFRRFLKRLGAELGVYIGLLEGCGGKFNWSDYNVPADLAMFFWKAWNEQLITPTESYAVWGTIMDLAANWNDNDTKMAGKLAMAMYNIANEDKDLEIRYPQPIEEEISDV